MGGQWIGELRLFAFKIQPFRGQICADLSKLASSGEPNNPISSSYPALEEPLFSISKELVSPILVHLRCKASTQLIIGKVGK